ncbi:MAG: hypothetical protein A2542_01520 [Parcubacteria group bacterium RIFOXYD2_FULL_52_8]|nr:MAG: hypothetical protein A2542_01520 [Parcubacteria group bacterium RIFOXYD2_FULL_52_8]
MSSIIHDYKGKEGLQQITTRSLEAKGEILIYETAYASLELFMPHEAAEGYRRQLLAKRLHVRQLTNQVYQHYSEVEGFHENVMDIRRIATEKLKIDREIIVYNDTVAIYQTKGEDLYGVEIVDASLAEQQRQLFELVWMQADRPANSRDSRTSIF